MRTDRVGKYSGPRSLCSDFGNLTADAIVDVIGTVADLLRGG